MDHYNHNFVVLNWMFIRFSVHGDNWCLHAKGKGRDFKKVVGRAAIKKFIVQVYTLTNQAFTIGPKCSICCFTRV